ncbi:hypothetical protein ADUPG1_008920, partial [Aduncisulcus paluster]
IESLKLLNPQQTYFLTAAIVLQEWPIVEEYIDSFYKYHPEGLTLEEALQSQVRDGVFKVHLLSVIHDRRFETPHGTSRVLQDVACIKRNSHKENQSLLSNILIHESYAHICAVSASLAKTDKHYETDEKPGEPIVHYIKDAFSGNSQTFFVLLAEYAISPPRSLARAIHGAVKGVGTKNLLLSYVVAMIRDKPDPVKVEFERKYKTSLSKWVQSDTKGFYENLLSEILGF